MSLHIDVLLKLNPQPKQWAFFIWISRAATTGHFIQRCGLSRI